MGDPRLSRLVIAEEHTKAINACLDRLVDDTNTRYAMLLDRSGQIIALQGVPECRELDGLGALLAGNFASAKAIAQLVGEDSFGAVFQQGQRQHIFTALVNDHWILSVVFDSRAPVGLVKVLCRRVVSALNVVHRSVLEVNRDQMEEQTLDPSFRVMAGHTIDLLLQEHG